VIGRLNEMPNVSCMNPTGAFYAFPNLGAYMTGANGISSSLDLCGYLLEKYNIAIVPGVAFGMDEHARLSYATSMDVLEIALDRIQTGLKSLS